MKPRALLRKLCAALLTGAVCAVQLSVFSAKAAPSDLSAQSEDAGWQAEVWVGEELKSRYLDFETAWSQAAELSRSLRQGGAAKNNPWNMTEDLLQSIGKEDAVTVKLLQDWKVSGGFPGSISEKGAVKVQDSSIVLDLNGHTVSRGLIRKQDNGQLFTVKGNAVFTVCDSDPTASNYGFGVRGGILTGGYSDDFSGCIEISSGGTFNFAGGSIVSCHSDKAGAAVRMADGGTLNVDGGSFYFNTETDDGGGAVYAKKGTVNLKNTVFEANTTTDDGGALRLDNTRLKAIDCIFRGNKAKDKGGAVYITGGDSAAEFDGCVFIENRAGDDGGAAYVDKCDYAFFRNSLFESNSAGDTGGAVHADYDNAVLDSVTIIGNTAKNGGGAYVYAKKDIAVQGRVIIRGNHDKNGNDNNLVLGYSGALFGSSKAYVNNGGLYEGSEIHVKADTGGTTKIGNNISVSQRQYFIADGGSLKMEKLEQRSERFVSSVIGEGSLVMILVGLMAMILAVAGVQIYRKHSSKQTEEKEA
ncbi:MAG: hypothetical protein IKS42_08590 [Oscillospiraceae bacterium]|nr:hypothetical protein [Oscillospiraceae bacterium]